MSLLTELDSSQLSSIDQGGKLWCAYREAYASSLFFASKAVLASIPQERNLISRACHYPLTLALEAFHRGEIMRLLLADPRKHLKSTIATRDSTLWRLDCKMLRGEDPNDRIAIISSVITNARRFLRDIKNVVETNGLYAFLFPERIPEFDRDDIWNQDEIVLPRTYNPKEPTIDTLGQGRSATTRHYDLTIEEDLINEENCDSPGATEKAIETHKLTEGLREDGKSQALIVGNFWGPFDLNSYITKEEPHTSVLCRGATHGPYLDEGERSCRGLPEQVMELLAQMPRGEPIWPERFSKEDLGRILLSVKPRIYMSQFENSPCDPEATDFQLDWLGECNLEYIDSAPYIRYEDDPTPVALADTHVYITWDPARGGKNAKSVNAILVSAIDFAGRVSILREHAKKEDPLDSIDTFIAFARLYQGYLKASGVEEVLFQKVLKGVLERRVDDWNKKQGRSIYLNLKTVKTPTHMTKEQRDRTWITALCKSGKVYVRRGCISFLEHYSHFGIANAPIDLIDAFAYAVRLYSTPLTRAQRQFEKRRELEEEQDRGPCGYGVALNI